MIRRILWAATVVAVIVNVLALGGAFGPQFQRGTQLFWGVHADCRVVSRRLLIGAPSRTRTGVRAVKERYPWPLDDESIYPCR